MTQLYNLVQFIFDTIIQCVGSQEFTASVLSAPFVFLVFKYIIDFFKALTRSI